MAVEKLVPMGLVLQYHPFVPLNQEVPLILEVPVALTFLEGPERKSDLYWCKFTCCYLNSFGDLFLYIWAQRT